MPTLLLKLAAPMQSWGDSSRFNHRHTRPEPTKSGVLGLLAAAQGRRRTDPIEDLLEIKFGVRTEQPGTLLRDFQTEISTKGKSHPLTYRYYLADAIFLAAVEAGEQLISGLSEALRNPYFPLYLGRRSCPPAEPLIVGIRDNDLASVLRVEPWRASNRHRKSKPSEGIRLPIVRDALPDEQPHETIRDLPLSFDQTHRRYGLRDVVHERSDVLPNPDGRPISHDPMALLGSADVPVQA